ncbi:MAG TPA: Gfo/Idh/MocA family oxidoreductase [Acidimicrobiia bacterium]|nr:Gfo/Idh/MocA family oxidoreductase [Acidimicrobiia bacterium]
MRWGVLGVADIAVRKVIPAMKGSAMSLVEAIASRTQSKASAAADELGIPRAYGSYEALLADDTIEAVYIPLPNHLHLEWTLAATAAGKHVLCEKPLALTSADARRMIDASNRANVLLMEAFMYRLHPLWQEVRRMIESGAIGELVAFQSFFSYRNLDPNDIRNQVTTGGGALLDIGCYPVNAARMLFGSEPDAVRALIRRHSEFGTDVLTSALLDFGGRHATFTVSTVAEPDQRVDVVGTGGRLRIEIPFNIPPDRPSRIIVFAGGEPPVSPGTRAIEVATDDQYRVQADAFSEAVRSLGPLPTEPTDAVANLEVLERIVENASR